MRVDLMLCETMASAEEARAAAIAAAESGKPVWVSWTLADDGPPRLRSGETLASGRACAGGHSAGRPPRQLQPARSRGRGLARPGGARRPGGRVCQCVHRGWRRSSTVAPSTCSRPGRISAPSATRTFALRWAEGGAAIVGRLLRNRAGPHRCAARPAARGGHRHDRGLICRYRPRMHDALPTARLLAVARGDEAPDTVIEGAQVFCAFTREWLEGDVAIADGRFAGVGAYEGGERIDGSGRFLTAGFIDAHMHVESCKLGVARAGARAASPAARRQSSAIRTSSPTRSAPRACTGSSTPARACRSTCSSSPLGRAGKPLRVAARAALAAGHRRDPARASA